MRRLDLEQIATKRIGATNPRSPEVDAEMRRMLRGQLVRAFQRPEMNALSKEEKEAYENGFNSDIPFTGGLPFLEFF